MFVFFTSPSPLPHYRSKANQIVSNTFDLLDAIRDYHTNNAEYTEGSDAAKNMQALTSRIDEEYGRMRMAVADININKPQYDFWFFMQARESRWIECQIYSFAHNYEEWWSSRVDFGILWTILSNEYWFIG